MRRLNPTVARWLRAEHEGADSEAGTDWEAWLLRRMNAGAIAVIDGVFVDRAVAEQRFACVPERCAPGRGRGKWRSCCADAEVALSPGELRRLRRHEWLLADAIASREPRLAGCGRGFWRADGPSYIARPGGRCAFSQIDGKGRIRCRLRALAKRHGLEQSDVQPLSCRLFPLIVVALGEGRTLLSVVSRSTSRLVATWPAGRFPCLNDESLPPLHISMRRDLDWLFGGGFARALAALG
ncbi:MAG: hypothetical protein ACOX6T_13480 [Myxococcales bacterium]|jgi:hypothetical protein